MMAEYVAGVDVYLSQVRDSSTKDAKAHQVIILGHLTEVKVNLLSWDLS